MCWQLISQILNFTMSWQLISQIYNFTLCWQLISQIYNFTMFWQLISQIYNFTMFWQLISQIHNFTMCWQLISKVSLSGFILFILQGSFIFPDPQYSSLPLPFSILNVYAKPILILNLQYTGCMSLMHQLPQTLFSLQSVSV